MELEDVGVEYEDTAVERYEVAVQKAAELKVRNEWTLRALKAVNQYKPEEYPLLREARRPAPLSSLTTQYGVREPAESPSGEAEAIGTDKDSVPDAVQPDEKPTTEPPLEGEPNEPQPLYSLGHLQCTPALQYRLRPLR